MNFDKKQELFKEYNALKDEIASDLNLVKNKAAKLYQLRQVINNNKEIPFNEHLLGLLIQDVEMYLSMKFSFGYIKMAAERLPELINKHIESLFNKDK